MIGVNGERSGYIAKILTPELKKCPITENLAILVRTKQDLLSYYDEQREEILDNETLLENQKLIENTKRALDVKTLLRDIKDLITSGDIIDGSGNFYC